MRDPLARAIVAALIACAAIMASATLVLADGGPHTAALASGTSPLAASTCSDCHRAQSEGASAITATPEDVALCMGCHGSSGAGATTNVAAGLLEGTGRGLRGGGFSSALMDTAWSAVAVSRPTTSAHGFDGTTVTTMWGNGPLNSGVGSSVTLTCTDCHDPHGSGTYRSLKPIPTGSNASTGVVVPDQDPPIYTVASPLNRYFGEEYADPDYQTLDELDAWCAQCHTRHDAIVPNAANVSSGDSIYNYRHTTRTNGVVDCLVCHNTADGGDASNPFGINGPGFAHEPMCQQCHVAHGSSAQMGTFSDNVPDPDGAIHAANDAKSSLLRLDNRGVCLGCHNPTD